MVFSPSYSSIRSATTFLLFYCIFSFFVLFSTKITARCASKGAKSSSATRAPEPITWCVWNRNWKTRRKGVGVAPIARTRAPPNRTMTSIRSSAASARTAANYCAAIRAPLLTTLIVWIRRWRISRMGIGSVRAAAWVTFRFKGEKRCLAAFFTIFTCFATFATRIIFCSILKQIFGFVLGTILSNIYGCCVFRSVVLG